MRLVLKTPQSNLYRLTDPEACVTPDEWGRVCNLIGRVVDIAKKEKVDQTELLLCMQEQLETAQ